MIGLKKSLNYSTNQMQNQNNRDLVTRVSRAWRWLRIFTSSFHWLIVLFTFIVIGHCNCFGLVLRHSNENHYEDNIQCGLKINKQSCIT